MLPHAYTLLKPLLFQLDPETAHHLTLNLLSRAPRLWAKFASLSLGPIPSTLAKRAFGVTLKSPIGLAAGLDKDGLAIPFWPALGFGFTEVGTVTAHPQVGNPLPRLFRLQASKALINRMGFNNRGSEALAKRIKTLKERGHWPNAPVGVNVGKSKITPLEEAISDYILSISRLQGLADWFTLNVSSPNTPGLRNLQDKDHLKALLPAAMAAAKGTPVLLKLAPDLSDQAISEAVEISIAEGLAGIIATNTTLRREMLLQDPQEAGGLSGEPLWPLARHAIEVALKAANGKIAVIGVGGISQIAQVQELLTLGCAGIQLYTGLIYEGPQLPARLNGELS